VYRAIVYLAKRTEYSAALHCIVWQEMTCRAESGKCIAVSGRGVAHREHSTVRTVISCAEQRMYVSDICQAQSNRMNYGYGVESNKGRKRGNAERLRGNKKNEEEEECRMHISQSDRLKLL
jgi:hypothetical protein